MKYLVMLFPLLLTSCFYSTDYNCKDDTKREKGLTHMCDLASSYVGTKYEVGRKWCKCVEELYDIQQLVPDSCEPKSGMIILDLRKKEGVMEKCGTMDKPKI